MEHQLALAKAHGSLGPKAIEKLSVQEARQQPTAADAVVALLQQQGKPTNPDALVQGVTLTAATVDGAGGPMQANVYTPTGTGPFPVNR